MSKREIVEKGQIYNNWTVIKEVAPYGYQRKFLCKCICGTEKIVFLNNMKRPNSSCGCYQKKVMSEILTIHGRSGDRYYENWCKLKERCYNFNSKDYVNYGGRGIYVCRRWRKNFLNFYKDMGAKPSNKHTLDRIDNNGPYAPWNCRWATRKQQSANKRNNVLIPFKGESMCVGDWAIKLNMNINTLKTRLFNNWSIEKALTTPVRGKNG